jgi:hypothetical protein
MHKRFGDQELYAGKPRENKAVEPLAIGTAVAAKQVISCAHSLYLFFTNQVKSALRMR